MESGYRILTSTDLNQLDTVQDDQLGSKGITADGRTFSYVKFGGTSTIKAGLLVVGPVAPANSTGLVITAVGTGGQTTANLQAGSKQIVVTNGATAVTSNQFSTLEIISVADGLYSVRVDGNTADAVGNATITLQLKDPLPQAMTQLIPGTDTVNLVVGKYNGCIPSTTGNAPVGVTVNAVVNTASVTNYGWVQTSGKVFLNATSAIGIGLGIAQDQSGTAGFVIVSAATTGNIGWAKAAAASNRVSAEINIA